jgi:flagellar biosynthesis/type III secretory pathway M-ring protein FliF/YscJ
MIAATSWPEAAVAMAGVLLVLSVAVALIVSVAATLRARMSVQRELAYRKLAEDSTAAQHRTADQLERAVAELGELRSRTGELERLIKAVE